MVLEIPPRLRGRVCFLFYVNFSSGNTPASAGKRDTGEPVMLRSRKYPRVCGEETLTEAQAANGAEIPPRLRGRD